MQAWSKISRMPAAGIKKLQEELLHKMITEEFAVRHPYYREMFKEKNIDPASIKGFNDLSGLPFTEKKDLLPPEDDPLHPKKFVLEQPVEGELPKKKGFSLFGKKETGPKKEDYVFHTLYFSSGRTAKPAPYEYTHYDLDNLKEAGLRAFDILEITRDDTLINAFTYAPNAYFWQMFYSTTGIGSTALQTGGGKVLGLEKILKALDSMEAPVLVAAPGYAAFALQTLDHFGFSADNLERIVIGIDYAPMESVEKIQKLMKSVGAKEDKVQRIYFLSEAKSGWAECAPDYGYHTNPDHVLIEIVDPESGEVLGEGEQGEVVVTHLDTRGTALLRFRTGDIATGGITTELCPNCKRTVPRILGDIERKDLYFEMKSKEGPVSFNANALRSMMFGKDDVLLWYAELQRSGDQDSIKITVKGVSGSDEDKLQSELKQEIAREFDLPVEVEGSTLDAVANKIGLEKTITEKTIFDNRQS